MSNLTGQNFPVLTNDALISLQALRTEMPERLWIQEFSILVDHKAFEEHLDILMNHQRREKTIQSRYAIARSKEYLLRATMSGENIRITDQYEEFIESPFWRTPYLMDQLHLLEEE